MVLLAQRIHDLHHIEKLSQRAIRERLGCARETVAKILRAPRPQDLIDPEMVQPLERVDKRDRRIAVLAPDDMVRQRINMPLGLQRRLLAESEVQGRPGADIVALAVEFYLDYVDRARNGGDQPINLMAFRRAA
jgi:DNA-binding transcriptional regulator LsrR (DeoR family)